MKNNSNIEKIFKEVAYQLYSGIKGKDNKKGDLKEYEIGGFKNIKIDDNKDNNNNNNEKKIKCCQS